MTTIVVADGFSSGLVFVHRLEQVNIATVWNCTAHKYNKPTDAQKIMYNNSLKI